MSRAGLKRPCHRLVITDPENLAIGLFADIAAILISIVSNSYYGISRGQIHVNFPPEYPIMSFETIEIKMAATSAKRSMGNDVIHAVILSEQSLWTLNREKSWERSIN